MTGPTVLLLDGGSFISLSIARELSEDLDAEIVGVGTAPSSRLLRSKYCDARTIAPPTDHDRYVESILRIVDVYRPHVVLPVGFDSTSRIERSREDFPEWVELCLPPVGSFADAIDKRSSSRYGERVGIETPIDYTQLVSELADTDRRTAKLSDLEFPVFLKPRWEVDDDHVTTAIVEEPAAFWPTYDRIVEGAPRGEVLVQEYVDGDRSTFGCGVLVRDGEVELAYSHEERRSVPRRGGSGTHLRILRDRDLEAKAIELLRELDWDGLALVEFKRRSDGSYVLMEVNPKFWASYALASRHGYRFASTLVASALDLEVDPSVDSHRRTGEMVFPLRELYFYAQHRDEERLLECLAVLAKPSAAWSLDWTDLRAWLTPPASVLERLPWADSSDERPLVAEPPAHPTETGR